MSYHIITYHIIHQILVKTGYGILQFLDSDWLPAMVYVLTYHGHKYVGGVVASWLVRWTPDQVVWVHTLARVLHSVLGLDTLLS